MADLMVGRMVDPKAENWVVLKVASSAGKMVECLAVHLVVHLVG